MRDHRTSDEAWDDPADEHADEHADEPGPQLRAALRSLGLDHEPDTERMLRRIDAAGLRSGAPVGRIAPARTRPFVVAGAAAAAVLAVLGAGELLLDRGPSGSSTTVAALPSPTAPSPLQTSVADPSNSASPPATGSATGSATGTATGTATGSATGSVAASSSPRVTPSTGTARTPDATQPSSGDLPGGTAPSTPPGPTPPSSGAPPSLSPPEPVTATAQTLTSAAQRVVSLATPAVRDWVVVGARNDGKQVRAKQPIGGQQLLQVTAPPGSTPVAGPLRLTWNGGIPEQDHVGASTWLHLPRGGALQVDLAASATPTDVVLYVGTTQTALQVSVSVLGATGGGGGGSSVGSEQASGVYAVSVSVPAGAQTRRITLFGGGTTQDAAIMVAAVMVS